MMNRNRHWLVAFAVALLLLSQDAPRAATAAAGDREFDAVVRLLESHYRVRRRRLPFMAGTIMRIAARRVGVRNLRLAVFEDQDFVPRAGDAEFATAVGAALSDEWQPLVRISAQNGERTLVHLREAGENLRLLIVNIERREASVVQAEVSPQTLAEWLQNPERMGRSLAREATDGTQE